MVTTIAIYSPKGGSGKSTHTRLLSKILKENYGYDVLVIDTDPQGSLKDLSIMLEEDNDVNSLIAIPVEMVVENLHNKKYDERGIVMLDIQGVLYHNHNEKSSIMELLKTVDIIIMPIRPSSFDAFSAIKFKPFIESLNSDCTFVAFLNEFKKNNESSEIEALLQNSGFKLLQKIKSSVHYPRLTISSYNAIDKKSKVREEYQVFTNQIINLINEYK